MKTISTWCCSKCRRLYEKEDTDKTLKIPPNKGKCKECGGELDRGLHPNPTRQEMPR